MSPTHMRVIKARASIHLKDTVLLVKGFPLFRDARPYLSMDCLFEKKQKQKQKKKKNQQEKTHKKPGLDKYCYELSIYQVYTHKINEIIRNNL